MTPKGQKLNTMNKVMFGVIPITMIILAMSSNVVFTLYVITNSLMTAIIWIWLHWILRLISCLAALKIKEEKEP